MRVSEGFNNELIEQLDRLHLRFSRQVGGVSGGIRRSGERGSSNEFSDFRSYNRGDSLRYVDWNSYARLGRLFVKLYNEEKQTEVTVVVDSSASMGLYNKDYTAGMVAASLVYTALAGGDRARMVIGERELALTSKRELARLLTFTDEAVYGGNFAPDKQVKTLSLVPRGKVLLISDFMYPVDVPEEALKYLTYKKQDTTLIMLLGDKELSPDFKGDITLKDSETNEKLNIEMTDEVIDAYRAALRSHRGKISDLCRKYGAEMAEINTGEPMGVIISKLLQL